MFWFGAAWLSARMCPAEGGCGWMVLQRQEQDC